MENWGLEAAGLAGNFLEGVGPLPSVGAWGMHPCLKPLVGGPQRLEPWDQEGQEGVLLASHLQLVAETLQEAISQNNTKQTPFKSVRSLTAMCLKLCQEQIIVCMIAHRASSSYNQKQSLRYAWCPWQSAAISSHADSSYKMHTAKIVKLCL